MLRTAPHPCRSSTIAKKAPPPPNTSPPHDVQTDRQTETDTNKHARKQNQHTRNMTRIKKGGAAMRPRSLGEKDPARRPRHGETARRERQPRAGRSAVPPRPGSRKNGSG